MHGPRLVARDEYEDDDQRPEDEKWTGSGYDLGRMLGPGTGSRLVGRRSWSNGGVSNGSAARRPLPPGGGYTPPVGAPREGEAFRTSRDLAAKREAYYGAKDAERESGIKSPWDKWEKIGLPNDPAREGADATAQRTLVPPRPVIPGERHFRDGDHVRHAAFGEGTVVTSKLTRDDEEVTVAFPERGVKKLLASMANLELLG